MSDRFQLETEITNLHTIADDLNLIASTVIEKDMPPDEIANALIGLSTILRLRVDNAFDCFKEVFNLDRD